MMNLLCWFSAFAVLMMGISQCNGNQMDPHVFPSQGPYFEGWYMRIMDEQAGTSVGWLFSRILPEAKSDSKVEQSYLSSNITQQVNAIILINSNDKSKLATTIKYFPLNDYKITKHGRPVVKNPDDATPPLFEAQIGTNVSFIVRPNGTKFSLTLGNTIIRGETDHPVPWGPHGEGPEGWIDKLPLPLHWFVYSLRSNVIHYEVTDKATGLSVTGGSKNGRPVLAHMEKNWGAAFPKAWVWAQGVDAATNVSFAISAGLLTKFTFDLPLQLSNYRNPSKGINCKFLPYDSTHTLDHDGCKGKAYLHVRGLFCDVVFELFTQPQFLSSCLTTPQVHGYALGCVESFNAVANITVFQRKGLDMVHTDSYVMKMTALEFGGEYMCNGKCP